MHRAASRLHLLLCSERNSLGGSLGRIQEILVSDRTNDDALPPISPRTPVRRLQQGNVTEEPSLLIDAITTDQLFLGLSFGVSPATYMSPS